jgi:hypothetical protein
MRTYQLSTRLDTAVHSIAFLACTLIGLTPTLLAQTEVTGDVSSPYGLAVDSSSNLYVTSLDGEVYEIPYGVSLPDSSPDLISSAFNEPTGVAISSSSGPLYVLDYAVTEGPPDSAIYSNGTVIDFPDLQEYPLEYGGGPALDSSGNIYFTDGDWGWLYEYNPGTNMTATLTQFYSPNAVVVDSSGNIYVADDTEVKVIYAGGITIPNVPSPTVGDTYLYAGGGSGCSSYPCSPLDGFFGNVPALAVDEYGDLYISAYAEEAILQVTTNGYMYLVQNDVQASGLAFDSNYGYLYYTEGEYVYRITP